jgi:hypothetical protein
VSARKSLIVEKTAAMCRPAFATSRAVFATSPVFALAAAVPFFFLSNSLKKKKKEYVEGRGISRKAMPRVGRVLPSVTDTAYFLGHELDRGATGFSWQLMAGKILINQSVTHVNQRLPRIHELFCPSPRRVAIGR